MIIDAHQHFWRPERGDYGWLEAMPPSLQQDYLPADFAPIAATHGIEGTVLVQAAPTCAETTFLLALADNNPIIRGVVGWMRMDKPDTLPTHDKLVAIRPMLQDIDDTSYILEPRNAAALEAITARGLAFDALVQPRHLGVLATLVQRHPNLRMVIDHGAKPDIAHQHSRPQPFADWAAGMQALAKNPGLHCKLSGLVTEAATGWTPGHLAPAMDVLWNAFGADRLIFGSDWPVMTLAGEYGAWLDIARAAIPASAQDRVFAGNATRFYQLEAA